MSKEGLQHCNSYIRITIGPIEDGHNTGTYAYCPECGLKMLMHSGGWEDERFLAMAEEVLGKGPQHVQ